MAEIVLMHPAGGYWELFRDAPAIPLNLLSAAAPVKNKFSVRIIDQRLGPGWRDSLAAAVGPETICFGATAYTGPSISGALEMCREARRLKPGAPIVWGGIHVSLLPRQSIRHPLVDIVAVGEGESVFPAVAERLAQGKSPEGIPGAVVSDEEDAAPSPVEFVDMNALPPVPYDLIDINAYLPTWAGGRHINAQTSRGCPMRCGFCYNTVFNRNRWRAMSPEKAFERIEAPAREFGVSEFLLVDDDFFVDLDRARRIMELLEPLRISWQSQGVDIATLTRMTDELLALTIRSGCRRLSLGVEAASKRVRKMLRKPGDEKLIVEQVRRLGKFGFAAHCNFIAGFPEETREEIIETRDLVFKLMAANEAARTPFIYLYTPYPGTDVFEKAVSLGFTPPERLEDWNEFNVDDFRPSRWNFPLGRGVTEKFLRGLSFATRFIDTKADDYNASRAARLAYALYKPIALFRTKRLFFSLMPERGLFERLTSLLIRRKWGKS